MKYKAGVSEGVRDALNQLGLVHNFTALVNGCLLGPDQTISTSTKTSSKVFYFSNSSALAPCFNVIYRACQTEKRRIEDNQLEP
jgi:hypothetical protein